MALFRFSPTLDPINALLNLQRELERVVDNPLGLDLGLSGRGISPAVNVFSDQDGYMVRMEVPGMSPEQLNIESHGRTLTLSGKRESAAPQIAPFAPASPVPRCLPTRRAARQAYEHRRRP